jgi:Ran-interacting Mog1 protein
MTSIKSTPLYSDIIDGGAMICDLPSDWKDVSEFHQVTDNVQFFAGPGDEEPFFVVAIHERANSVSDEEITRHFFDELAEANMSSENSFSVREFESTLSFYSGIGMQRFSRNDAEGNPRSDEVIVDVQIELCVLRLPQVETDLVLSLSRTKATSDEKFSEEFERIMSTLQILDWDLFGE